MTTANRFEFYGMTLPHGGPKAVPQTLDFTNATEIEVDLSAMTQNGFIDFISGVWVDNSANTETLSIKCNKTSQIVKIPAGRQGYFPLIVDNPPKFICSTDGAVIINVIFYNIPQFPYISSAPEATPFGGAFINLSDVPQNYTGAANKIVSVNGSETGLDFVTQISQNILVSVASLSTNYTVTSSDFIMPWEQSDVNTLGAWSEDFPTILTVPSDGIYIVSSCIANTSSSVDAGAIIIINAGSDQIAVGYYGSQTVCFASSPYINLLAGTEINVQIINVTGERTYNHDFCYLQIEKIS